MKKRKVRRFQEGAYLDFEREPLRDSSGEIVRSGMDTYTNRFDINRGRPLKETGTPVMSGSVPQQPEAAPVAQSFPVRKRGAPEGTDVMPTARRVNLASPGTAAESAEGIALRSRLLTEGSRGAEEPRERIMQMKPSGAEDSGTGQLAGIKANIKAPTKQPVVTQEQMRKAGFDNLRDYLNAQRSMTRKQEPVAPVKAAPQKAEPPKMDRQAELDRLMKYDKPLETVAPEMALLGGPLLRGAKALGSSLLTKTAPKQAARRGERTLAPERGGGRDPGARRPTQDELDEIRMGSDFMKKGGQVKAKKQSSTVSSASKRADGIAMRGKTRGKYL